MPVYKKLTDIPYRKRVRGKALESGKTVKAIKPAYTKIIESKGNRQYVSLGDLNREDIAGTVKGFRQANKNRAMQVLILQEGSNKKLIARGHFVSSNTRLLESEALGMISKYRIPQGKFRVIVTVYKNNAKPKTIKPARKPSAKAPAKKGKTSPVRKSTKGNSGGAKKKAAKKVVKKNASKKQTTIKKKATKATKKITKKPTKVSKKTSNSRKPKGASKK
jgi:hypothetical protein